MSQNRKSALAGALLIFLIIIGDILTGAVGIASPISQCNTPAILHQCGTQNCVIAVGGSNCSTSITFAPSFTSTPTYSTCGFPISQGTVSGVSGSFAFIGHEPAAMWESMPSATTPLFNNGTYTTEHIVGGDNYNTLLMQVWFYVDVILPSANASGILQLQFSQDNGGTWNTFAGSAVTISTAGYHVAIITPPAGFLSTLPSNIFRVIGNGNDPDGLSHLDNPSFTEIGFSFRYTWTIPMSTTKTVSKTTLTCAILFPAVQPGTFALNWEATQ